MALVKATLKGEIKTAFTSVMDQADDKRGDALDAVADKLADAVINAIKSQTITVAGVITAGGPATQTQTVPVIATIA
jgi:site-specific recombinase